MHRHTVLAGSSLVLLLGSAFAAHAQTTIVYANEDNFSGYSISNGGAATGKKNTYMVADDINTIAGYGGLGVVSLDFSIGNLNTANVSVSPILNFYATNGTGGNPGTLLGTVTLNAVSVPNGVSLYTYAPTTGTVFTIPTSGSFWAGMTFTSTASAASLNNIGQGTFDPPTIGTSQDLLFETNNTGTFKASNPAGAQYTSPFGGTPVGNLGWEFEVANSASAAPEPSQAVALWLVAAGLGGLILRRRAKVSAANSDMMA